MIYKRRLRGLPSDDVRLQIGWGSHKILRRHFAVSFPAQTTSTIIMAKGTFHSPFNTSAGVLITIVQENQLWCWKSPPLLSHYCRVLCNVSAQPHPASSHLLRLVRDHQPKHINCILTVFLEPRRAAVALLIRVVPAPTAKLPDPTAPPPTLTEFFEQDWVKDPSSCAEVLFLHRQGDTTDNASTTHTGMRNQREAHVAFPGGRTEPYDEGELYTGTPLPFFLILCPVLTSNLAFSKQCGRPGKKLASTSLKNIMHLSVNWTTVKSRLHLENVYL